MVDKHNEQILLLRNKFKTIINLYEEKKQQNKVLTNKNSELNDKLIVLQNKLSETEKRNDSIHLAKAINSSTGNNSETKMIVNRIMREIDKCIALLNR